MTPQQTPCGMRAKSKLLFFGIFLMSNVAEGALNIQLECYGDLETMLNRYQVNVEQSKRAAKSWCSGEFPPGWSREINGREIQLPTDAEGFFKDSCTAVQQNLLWQIKRLSNAREVCASDSWGWRTVISAVGEFAVTETTNCATPDTTLDNTWNFESEVSGPWSLDWVFTFETQSPITGSSHTFWHELTVLDDSKGWIQLEGADGGGYRLIQRSSHSPDEYSEQECREL